MSTRIRFVLASLLIAILGVGAWFFWGASGSSTSSSTEALLPEAVRDSHKAARGTPEDPDARRAYELRRLRDPETGRLPDDVRKKELAFAEQLPGRVRKSSARGWQLRGPANVGGRSRALGIDVRSPNADTILAGGVSGGMWRTADGGQSWTRTFDPDQRPNVTALAQDSRSGRRDVWYAGTGEFRGNSASGGGAFFGGNGIYRSVDGGKSWALLPSTTSDETTFDNFFDYTHAVEVDPTAAANGGLGTDSEVYAAVYGRIYRTTDGGQSWTAALTSDTTDDGVSNFSAWTDVEVTTDGEVYAVLSSGGDRSGLFYSPTGEKGSWTDVTPDGWPTSSLRRTVLAINPSDEDEVWAVMQADFGAGPSGHELWMYDQNTDVWTDSTEYLPDRNPGGFIGSFNSQGGYDLIVDVHPDDGDVIFAGGINLWRIDVSSSASDPAAWIGGYDSQRGGLYDPPGSDSQHPDQHALAFVPNDGDVMFSGSDGGIHRTDDNRAGGTGSAGDREVLWNDLNNGYFTTQFYAACQFRGPDNQTERARVAGGLQDNGTWSTASNDPTEPWEEQFGADGGYCALTNNAGDEGSSRYVSTQGGRVYRLGYDADGTPRSSERVDPGRLASGQLFINPFALDPSASDVMYYPAGSALWRNQDVETDPGDWTAMDGASVPGETITALGVSTTNDAHVLYYGTDRGTVKRLSGADTVDTSTDPTDVTGTNFPETGDEEAAPYVSSIAVDPTDSEKVMVVFSNYNVMSLFYSTDGGESWTEVEGNLGVDKGFSPSVRSAAILPRAGTDTTKTTFYVGTSIGVYSTTSLEGSDTEWTQEGTTEVGDVVVDQVQARSYDGRVVAATHGNGVYDFKPQNAPPVAKADTFEARAGTALAIAVPGVLGNDADADSLSASVVSAPSNGSLTLEEDGAFEYVPDADFTGTDAFTYRAVDPPGLADTATVQLDVGANPAPQAPVQLAVQKAEADLQLSWSSVPAGDLSRYRIYRDTAPIDQVTGRAVYDSVSASDTSYVDSGPAPGQTYYYRVTAVDGAGQEGGASEQDFAFIRKERVSAGVSRSFGDAGGPGDYRLVGLPGRVDTSLAQTLDGEAGVEWQAYWDDGSTLVRYDGSGTFDFQEGRGFWVTSRQDWTVEGQFSFVTLRGDTAATVPLNDGWTIISNPFDKGVSWDAVEQANRGDLQPLWPFNGAFNATADTFASAAAGGAYYFLNDNSGRDSLVVPYPGAPKSAAASTEKEHVADDDSESAPLLALSAQPTRGEGPASTVRLGLGEERALIAPPGRFEPVSLRIQANADEDSRLLMVKERPATDGGHTFALQLQRRVDGPVQLNASTHPRRTNHSAVLLRPEAGTTHDLGAESSVSLDPDGEKATLKVAVGTEAYVNGKTREVLPDEVRLTSYPNPVRRQGTFEFALPDETDVTLRVYDVLGREVATLASGSKEAGRHTVELRTEELSSGVYFGRLRAGGQTVTQKITVVR